MRKLVARVPRSSAPPGTMLKIEYPPFHVLLVNLGGVAYAIDDTCNHAGESLSRGGLDGCEIACPAHGYVFDVRTGMLITPAGVCDAQRTFDVIPEGNEFVVYDHVPDILSPVRNG